MWAHMVLLHQFETIAGACRLKNAGPHNSARAQHADFRRKEVHGTSTPTGATGLPAVQLRHQFSRMHSLRQSMSMPSVRAEYRILVPQMRTYAGRHRFLSHISVAGAGYHAALVRLCQPLLDNTDDKHRPVKAQPECSFV